MTLDEWLEHYPQSPLGVLVTLLEQWREGERDLDNFDHSLAVFDEFLQEWAQAVAEDDSEGELSEGLTRALQGLADAAAGLREYAESGDEEVADAAMAVAVESQELLLEMLELTQEPF
jgi:hypothetical protein